MTEKNPLQRLRDYGQSVWVDNLSRHMLESGELDSLIKNDGVVGITSNPTIFDAAISETDDYDDQMRELISMGRSVPEIYDELTVQDIQTACDILRPIYDKTNHIDGVVSLEVSPKLAHDTDRTISEARRLNSLVDRPNVMIKIPGTPEGVPAIEQCLYEGINVNITLLFSLDAYRAVMDAYLRAMERRVREGKPVDSITSVASFFVSRVDSEVDKRFQAIIDEEPGTERAATARALAGQIAIANARLAYQEFKNVFGSDRFAQLAGMGVRVQRPLWASTSTKNPEYPDTLYIDELIGPNTVQTMAPGSIDAFRERGKLNTTVEKDLDTARDALDAMESLGIAYDDVISVLVREGVEKFAESFDSLLQSLDEKCQRLTADLAQMRRSQIGELAEAVDEQIGLLRDQKAAEKLRTLDPTFWTDDRSVQKSISDRLGWFLSIEDMLEQHESGVFSKLAGDVRRRGYKHAVLLGMGGSSLAPEVMSAILPSKGGFPKLEVLDSTNPDAIMRVMQRAATENTLFIVSSKSGTTVETESLFHFFLDQRRDIGDDFIAITDPGSRLEVQARQANCWKVFTNRHDIGGRYSALSYFGLVPAAVAGIDVERLLESAASLLPIHDEHHEGVWLGAMIASAHAAGRDKLTILAEGAWEAFGDWLEQLVAESTGKNGTGIIPVVREEPHDAGAYADDRLFVHIGDTGGVLSPLANDLRQQGHPVIEQSPDLGKLFLTWEIATAVAGQALGINPFDEPNVQEAKDATNRVLGGKSPEGLTTRSAEAAIDDLLSYAEPGKYVAILAFVDPDETTMTGLHHLRREIANRTGLAVTLGIGPRYLHSTGQLHKGGPDNGLFLQIVSNTEADIEVPGKDFTFGQLFAAQSSGDAQALNGHQRQAWLVETDDVTETLAKLISSARGAEVTAD